MNETSEHKIKHKRISMEEKLRRLRKHDFISATPF